VRQQVIEQVAEPLRVSVEESSSSDMLNTPSEGARWCLRMVGEGVLRAKGNLCAVEDNGAVVGPSSKKIDCCSQAGTF
jgi:hypothetical protein